MTRASERSSVDLLFVDDEPDNFEVLRGRLERAFRDLGCEVRFVVESDPDAACERILSHPGGPFPIVVADLLFAPPNTTGRTNADLEARGLEVVEEARRASEHTVIVALTQGSAQEPELPNRATDAGADIVLLRLSLRTTGPYGGPAALVKKIHALLCERGLLDVGPILDVPDEPGIQSIVYQVNPITIRLLLAELFGDHGRDPTRVALTFVTPGVSGSQVLRAEATLADGSRRRLLVKVGRNHEALRRELENSQRAAGLYAPTLVVPYMRPATPRNGWLAIATLFADDAVTLRQWLADDSAAVAVPHVLRLLFLNGGLIQGYNSSVPPERAERRPSEYLALPPFRRVRVRAAVRELAKALNHPEAAGIADSDEVVRVVEGFARDGRLDNVPAADTGGDLLLGYGHGDLHAGNVLIKLGTEPAPMVVDLAAFGVHHWTTDVARLTVDLLMRSLDSTVESFFWRRFAIWRSTARQAGELESDPASELIADNLAVITSLRWIAEHRAELLRPLSRPERWWEWHLALAERFLRGTYQSDLSPAKRTLALVAGYDQIIAAAQKIPPRTPTF